MNSNPFREPHADPVSPHDFIGESAEISEEEKLAQFKEMLTALSKRGQK